MKTQFLVLFFTLFTLAGCTFNETTNDIYLIPEGYEGYVYAFYNVKGAPEVDNEGDYQVYSINKDGYFVTSTSDMDYGTVTDQYYYVDENGHRTEIKQECIRGLGTGSFENDPDSSTNIHIRYTGIEVTRNGCSQEFIAFGNGMSIENVDAVFSKVLKKYYGVTSMMEVN